MAYVNKNHKINFALDDNDFAILERATCNGYFSYAEIFRQLLRTMHPELIPALLSAVDEIKDLRSELFKLVRS